MNGESEPNEGTPFAFVCLICVAHRISTIDQLPEGLDDSVLLPLGVIEMTSYGHCGTTLFDPCDDGTQVVALICDACMEKRRGRLMHIDKRHRLSPFNKAMGDRTLEDRT